jgi:hypothetical protein
MEDHRKRGSNICIPFSFNNSFQASIELKKRTCNHDQGAIPRLEAAPSKVKSRER